MGKNGKKNQRKSQMGVPQLAPKLIEVQLPEIPKMDEKKLFENEEEAARLTKKIARLIHQFKMGEDIEYEFYFYERYMSELIRKSASLRLALEKKRNLIEEFPAFQTVAEAKEQFNKLQEALDESLKELGSEMIGAIFMTQKCIEIEAKVPPELYEEAIKMGVPTVIKAMLMDSKELMKCSVDLLSRKPPV